MQGVLRKRVLRDLRENLFRYLALSALIIFSMYLVISMLGAAETIIRGTGDFAKQKHLEDGEFTVFVPLKEQEIASLEKKGVEIEPIFSMDYSMEDKSVMRVFQVRKDIDQISAEQGELPKSAQEILVEKRYSDEHHLQVGDTITIGKEKFRISGIGCTPDYDAPYKSVTDSSVDSTQFGTSFLTEEGYQKLKDHDDSMKAEEYTYAYALKKGMTNHKLKKCLQEYKVEAADIEDRYFQKYWEEHAGDASDLTDGIDDLEEGANKLADGLQELKDYKGDMQKGATQIWEAYLKEASDGLEEYGLTQSLTEENYRTELKNLYDKSDNAFLRMRISSLREQLTALQAYKDGVVDYTKGVDKAAKGASKVADGMTELQDGKDEFMDEYLDLSIDNLTQFLTAEDNPRIGASADDQVINKVGGLVAGVIIIILFAYVISMFVIHGIERESSVIGALYALGVTRKDLLLHYLTLPVSVTFVASLIGTAIGYSPMVIQSQMKDSYAYFSNPQMSPRYVPYILLYGLVMPVVVSAFVNWIVIRKKLSSPVLAMMRKEAKEPKVHKVQLRKFGFVGTFRIRQMLRELRTSFTVVFGLFITLLIAMLALDCYVMCDNVKVENRRDTKYSYMYTYKYPDKKVPEHGTEAFAKGLKREQYGYNLDVTLLGITNDNPYFDAHVAHSANSVVISSAASQKYQLDKGDKIILTDEEQERDYVFTIDDVTQYATGLYAFMDIDCMRDLFGESNDYFNVVFSDRKLSIPSGKLYSVTSKDEIAKSSEVFVNMMKPMVVTLLVAATVIFCVVMYLMMKVMIDRSAFGISLVKIFGYRMSEIRKLYLNGNFYVIALGTAICIPLSKLVMDAMYPLMVSNVASAINIHFSWQLYVGLYLCIIVLYFVINHFLVRRLRSIQPAEVLKNRE